MLVEMVSFVDGQSHLRFQPLVVVNHEVASVFPKEAVFYGLHGFSGFLPLSDHHHVLLVGADMLHDGNAKQAAGIYMHIYVSRCVMFSW